MCLDTHVKKPISTIRNLHEQARAFLPPPKTHIGNCILRTFTSVCSVRNCVTLRMFCLCVYRTVCSSSLHSVVRTVGGFPQFLSVLFVGLCFTLFLIRIWYCPLRKVILCRIAALFFSKPTYLVLIYSFIALD